MKKFISILLVISLIAVNLPTVLANEEKVFSDIEGHWAENSIKELNAYGLISGYKDGTFRPDNTVSRAEMIAWVTRVLKYKMTPERYKQLSSERDVSRYQYRVPMSLANYFIDYKNLDIDKSYWCKKAIEEGYWLQILPYDGITKPARTYLSAEDYNKPASRGEFAYCITRAAEWFEDEFPRPFKAFESYVKKYITDLENSMEFPVHSERAYLQGFFSGYSDKTFKPERLLTRAEATAVLLKLIDVKRLSPFTVDERYIVLNSICYSPHYYEGIMVMEPKKPAELYPPYYRAEGWVVEEVLEVAKIMNESASKIHNYDKDGYQQLVYSRFSGLISLKFYESYLREVYGSNNHEKLQETELGWFHIKYEDLETTLKRNNKGNLFGCIYLLRLNPQFDLLKKYHWGTIVELCNYLFDDEADDVLNKIIEFYSTDNEEFTVSYRFYNGRKVEIKEFSDGVIIINIEVKEK